MTKAKTVDLNERLTRKARQVETVKADPAIPTRMPVTLDRLVPYDQNPRQTQNPKYDEIKDSIRHRGLDEPPSITRRPGDDKYMIRRGGNTRLQILNELWEETKEDRFFHIDCMFHPWVDDEDALAGHLVENDMRGGMLLIERALGAKHWMHMLEEKAGEPISQRKAAKAMTERGWKMNDSNLSVLIHAVDRLLPFIPDALWAGMGVHAVKAIRALEKGYQTYWDAIVALSDKAPAVEWETLWTDTLKEFDDIKFDIPEFRRTLDFKASDALELSHNTLRSEVDAILAGGKPPTERPIDPFAEHPPFSEDPRQTPPSRVQRNAETPHPGNDQVGRSETSGVTGTTQSSGQPGPENAGADTPTANASSAARPSQTPGLASAPTSEPALQDQDVTPEHRSVSELQALAYQTASDYMAELGMDDLVEPAHAMAHGQGFGYRLLPISRPIPPSRRPYYWALLHQLLAALEQLTDPQANQNLKDFFLPESLDTVLGTLYPEAKDGTEMQQSMVRDLLSLQWLRSTPESIVGVPHPDKQSLHALNELERCIAALRHAVDDDVDSLFISS